MIFLFKFQSNLRTLQIPIEVFGKATLVFLLPEAKKERVFFCCQRRSKAFSFVAKKAKGENEKKLKKSSVSDDLKSCSCSKPHNVFVQQKNKQFASWNPFFLVNEEKKQLPICSQTRFFYFFFRERKSKRWMAVVDKLFERSIKRKPNK